MLLIPPWLFCLNSFFTLPQNEHIDKGNLRVMPNQSQVRPESSLLSATTGVTSDNREDDSNTNTPITDDGANFVTILGFGSLLSMTSARTTFPDLKNFRLGRVHNYRRVFGHPASIFFQRNIANWDTLEMSSLSAEYSPGSSFVCSVFEVSNENGEFMERSSKVVGDDDEDDHDKDGTTKPGSLQASMAFREREEEFDIAMVPFEELKDEGQTSNEEKNLGVLCCRSTDETYKELWGQARFDENYGKYKIDTIWNWKEDSGLRPCAPYLRHCVLASMKMGKLCHDSFLDETFLVDRTTTIRSYLEKHPSVMDTLPPPELQHRYGG